MLEATFYPPVGPDPAPLAIFTHGSDVGRNQLRSWSFSTEAHWFRERGFAVLAVMRRGRGRSEGINGEENFARAHDGSVTDFSAGIAEAVADLELAIAYGRKLPGVRRGPVLLAGQSRGGFLSMHYAGLKPGEVMAVVNFSGSWYPYAPLTTPYYANAGRSAADRVPQLWIYADNDKLYDEALICGHRRTKGKYKTRIRMPSKLDPYLATIEDWLAAEPQLTALAIVGRLAQRDADQFGPKQHSIVQRLLKALCRKAAERLIAATTTGAAEVRNSDAGGGKTAVGLRPPSVLRPPVNRDVAHNPSAHAERRLR